MVVAEMAKIIDFIHAVKDLKEQGQKITNNDEMWEANYKAMEEIECMIEHCDSCIAILKATLK